MPATTVMVVEDNPVFLARLCHLVAWPTELAVHSRGEAVYEATRMGLL